VGVCGTVEFFWLHQTILPPTPILLHGPLKKPSHPLLFYLSNCYWQKTSTFARVFFSMISCEKTKKTLQRARNNALLIFLHHPKTSFFCHTTPEYTGQNPAAGSLGGGGNPFWTVNHRVNWFSYVLEVPWIRRCLYIYLYISVLSSFPLLLLLLLLLSTSLKKYT